MAGLDLLVIADPHFSSRPDPGRPAGVRRTGYGLELVRRAMRRLGRETPGPDLVILAGDIVDDGTVPGAAGDLGAVCREVLAAGRPVIVAAGNHDGPPGEVYRACGAAPGARLVGADHLVYVFDDRFAPDGRWRRTGAALRAFEDACRRYPGRKILAVQHAPVYPLVEKSYPYNPENYEEIHRVYARNRVALSLSGHYHPGAGPLRRDGVAYLAAPALCQEPFPFLRLRLAGNRLSVRRRELKMPPGLVENHCHSQFAYCAADVGIDAAIDRACLVGLAGICFTEHAGQLYLTGPDYWAGRHYSEPGLIRAARSAGADRLEAYRRAVRAADRRLPVRLGLELEVDRFGALNLLPEDRAGWDLLIGAVHFLPPGLSPGGHRPVSADFLWASEQLLKGGVAVLAHPMRFLRGQMRRVPAPVRRSLVGLLRDHRAAAELNFHHNEPDPRFFSACLEAGVRISLGGDAHALVQVGNFSAHLDFLAKIGAGAGRLEEVLFRVG